MEKTATRGSGLAPTAGLDSGPGWTPQPPQVRTAPRSQGSGGRRSRVPWRYSFFPESAPAGAALASSVTAGKSHTRQNRPAPFFAVTESAR